MPHEPKVQPHWHGRPIASDGDVHGLEQAAALHEFGNKLPREDAEERAHTEYKRDQHARAAAHHLQGMRAAHAAGDLSQARKHHVVYSLHLRELGADADGAVPHEVQSHIDPQKEPGVAKFKAHGADRLILDANPGEPLKQAEKGIQGRLGDILRACRLIVSVQSLE